MDAFAGLDILFQMIKLGFIIMVVLVIALSVGLIGSCSSKTPPSRGENQRLQEENDQLRNQIKAYRSERYQ